MLGRRERHPARVQAREQDKPGEGDKLGAAAPPAPGRHLVLGQDQVQGRGRIEPVVPPEAHPVPGRAAQPPEEASPAREAQRLPELVPAGSQELVRLPLGLPLR